VTSKARAPDFGRLAASYDRLRAGIPGLDEALVEQGDLRGRRVLDIGCGTGRFAEVLATTFAARVFGVDAEPEMLAVARRRRGRGLAFKEGRAEHLPFKEGWFERATMVLACHLVERGAAFAEARRILRTDGRFALATFDPAYLRDYYLNEYFPSVLEIDLARFPAAAELEAELGGAGFPSVRVEHFVRDVALDRETALARIRGRHISTFDLIDANEYRHGLERAERELPEQIDYRYNLLIVTADRTALPRPEVERVRRMR
jgi:SAM-dependent methyltransferase